MIGFVFSDAINWLIETQFSWRKRDVTVSRRARADDARHRWRDPRVVFVEPQRSVWRCGFVPVTTSVTLR